MNFVAVAIVSAIVLGHPFNHLLIGLNRILLCLNHSSQITRKNVVEKKGFGAWFMKLFAIVKTRNSCQPEQGIEPSFSSTVTKDDLDQGQEIQDDTPVDVEENQSTKSVANTSEREQRKDLFVPTKHTRRSGNDELKNAVAAFNETMENDSMKDLLQYFKDENERSRIHERNMMQMQMDLQMHMFRMLASVPQEASYTQQAMQTSQLPIMPPTHPPSQPAFHQDTRPMDTRQVIQSQQAYPSQHQYQQQQLFASSLLLDSYTTEGSQSMCQTHVLSRAHLTSSTEAYGINNIAHPQQRAPDAFKNLSFDNSQQHYDKNVDKTKTIL